MRNSRHMAGLCKLHVPRPMNQAIPCPTIFPALPFTYRRNQFGMCTFYFQGTSGNSGNGSFGAMTLQSQLGANEQPPGELRDGQELGRITLALKPSQPGIAELANAMHLLGKWATWLGGLACQVLYIYSVLQTCEGQPAGSRFYMRISVRGTVLIQGVAQIPLSSTFVLGSPCSNLLSAGPCDSWAPARNTKISEGFECHTGTNNQVSVLFLLAHVCLTAGRATCNRTG